MSLLAPRASDPQATPASPAPVSRSMAPAAPPYLVWPVSRREFYRSIWLAMLPAFAWASVIFGIRVIAMLVASVLAASCAHILLRRVLPWPRGHALVYAHTLVSTLILVGLAHPLWPVWVVVCMAFLIPLFLAVLGGPGKERVHVAVVVVLAIQFAVMPLIAGRTYSGGVGGKNGNALLARDRLVMGDIREHQPAAFYQWPSSRDLGGSDSVQLQLPAQAAADILNELSRQMTRGAAAAPALGLNRRDESAFRTLFDNAFSSSLPGMDMLVAGAVPGRVATVSLIGIALAGLYLAYRSILRPRSAAIFLITFSLVTLLLALWPSAIARVGLVGLWNILKTFPGEIGTLINIFLLNSDAFFAAVFILALPGTEPLTPRGRRMYLPLAALLAATLHRLDPAIPAASLSLCLLMPLTRVFDRLFGKRSWLNVRA